MILIICLLPALLYIFYKYRQHKDACRKYFSNPTVIGHIVSFNGRYRGRYNYSVVYHLKATPSFYSNVSSKTPGLKAGDMIILHYSLDGFSGKPVILSPPKVLSSNLLGR